MYFILEDDSRVEYHIDKNELYYNDNKITVEDNYSDNDKNTISLRIVLGKNCNFNCIYCMQEDQRHNISTTYKLSLEEFCSEVLRFVGDRKISSCTFWGGEPLLYMNDIKYIYSKLKDKCVESSNGNFCVVTNGSLLKGNTAFWFIEHMDDWFITISYDGIGQSYRGVDILDQNLLCGQSIKDLIEQFPDKVSMSSVLNDKSWKIDSIFDQVEKHLGFKCFNSYDVDFVLANNEHIIKTIIPEEYHEEAIRYNYNSLYNGTINPYNSLEKRGHHFLRNLNSTKFSGSCHAACDGVMSVDLMGNILMCQNCEPTGVEKYSNEPYVLSNIKDLEANSKVILPQLKTLNKRWNTICTTCPVRFICYGGCPIVNMDLIEENCNMFKIKNLIIFLYIISLIFKQKVKRVIYDDSLGSHKQFDILL